MNKFNTRPLLVLFLVLSMPLAALGEDKVVMKNGDVITGNVSAIVDAEVFIEPSYADEFAVDLAEVASIDLAQSFEVELEDASVSDGQIMINESGEQVLLVDGEERIIVLTEIARATEPESYFDWGAKVDFNLTNNEGNTVSSNTLLYAEGNVKHGDHRHLGNVTFAKEEVSGVQQKDQTLFNYSYNWLLNDPWYLGGSFTYERDPIRELEHRYTAGLIFGRDIFDDANRFMTFSLGAGFSDETLGGISESGTVGLWTFIYNQKFWDGNMEFFHNNNLTQQFYGEDNLIIKTNTGLNFDIVSDLYANVSFRYDYETEPAEGRFKDDSTLYMGIGYKF